LTLARGKMPPVRKLRPPHVSTLPVLGIVLAAGLLAVEYSSQATQWAVMTDELQTSKLATSIGETLSPVPRIHGAYYGALNQLYPLLLAPLYRWLSAPAAFDGAHVLNAFLLASSAWPAYLLGRAVTRKVAGGYFAAALTAFTPWLVLSSTLLTENAAYPAFVWAVFLCHRTLVEPSGRRDAAAVGALVLAYLARTQLFVLAVALPIAVLAYERRRAYARHRLLAAAYGVGGAVAVGLAAAGSLTRVLGNYAGTVQGDVLPAGIWHSAAVHLDEVVVGTGVAPFLLAAAWVFTPSRREARAFAALLVPLVVLLTFETASFDLRFTPGGFTQDRYVCYLAPLLAVGAAACLLDPGRRALRAGLVLAAGLAFLGLAAAEPFDQEITLWWASPAGAFHRALRDTAHTIGLSADDLVRYGGLVFAAALAGAVWRLPARVSLSVLGVALAAYGAYEAQYVFDWQAVPATTRPQTVEGVRRDWIDAALPAGASVALLPTPELAREYWWDAELWNKTVDRTVTVGGQAEFTPFAAADLSLDPRSGRLRGDEPAGLLVVDDEAPRLRLAGTVLARARPLALVRPARPYRAEWLLTGTKPAGWAQPGKPVRFRFFGGPKELDISLRAPFAARRPQRFVLRAGRSVRAGSVPPGGVANRRLRVCRVATLVAGGRVSLHLDRIAVRPVSGSC
jgi:hypothetical protein